MADAAEGVVIRRKSGSLKRIRAGRVILAAGALQSPAILMREVGIGPGEHLRARGIAVAVDRPGVGQNLRDHPALTFWQFLPKHLRLAKSFRRSRPWRRCASLLPGGTPSDMYIELSARAAGMRSARCWR